MNDKPGDFFEIPESSISHPSCNVDFATGDPQLAPEATL